MRKPTDVPSYVLTACRKQIVAEFEDQIEAGDYNLCFKQLTLNSPLSENALITIGGRKRH